MPLNRWQRLGVSATVITGIAIAGWNFFNQDEDKALEKVNFKITDVSPTFHDADGNEVTAPNVANIECGKVGSHEMTATFSGILDGKYPHDATITVSGSELYSNTTAQALVEGKISKLTVGYNGKTMLINPTNTANADLSSIATLQHQVHKACSQYNVRTTGTSSTPANFNVTDISGEIFNAKGTVIRNPVVAGKSDCNVTDAEGKVIEAGPTGHTAIIRFSGQLNGTDTVVEMNLNGGELRGKNALTLANEFFATHPSIVPNLAQADLSPINDFRYHVDKSCPAFVDVDTTTFAVETTSGNLSVPVVPEDKQCSPTTFSSFVLNYNLDGFMEYENVDDKYAHRAEGKITADDLQGETNEALAQRFASAHNATFIGNALTRLKESVMNFRARVQTSCTNFKDSIAEPTSP